jgi:DnaJ-class molecular chaperone
MIAVHPSRCPHGAPTTRLGRVSEQAAEPTAPESCAACRGSGSVISNLGGEPHQLACPWCDGGGVVLGGHDAQAHWRAQQPSERA